MATKKNVVGEAAAELTRQQVQQALAIAGASNFNSPADPAFVGSILVALVANYVGFIEPKLALISNILVMALVLIWRPQGLFPVARR